MKNVKLFENWLNERKEEKVFLIDYNHHHVPNSVAIKSSSAKEALRVFLLDKYDEADVEDFLEDYDDTTQADDFDLEMWKDDTGEESVNFITDMGIKGMNKFRNEPSNTLIELK